jgi:hypothetical protein
MYVEMAFQLNLYRQSIDGPPRDADCLAGIEPLELLLMIPHRIAAAPAVAWVLQDALGLLKPP